MMMRQKYLQFVIYFFFSPLLAEVVQLEYIDKMKLYSTHHNKPEAGQMHEDLYVCLILLQKVYTSENIDYPCYKAYEFLLRVIFHLYDQLNIDYSNNTLFLLLQERIAALKKMCMNDKNILNMLTTELHAVRFIPIPISPNAFGSGVVDILKIVAVAIVAVCVYKSAKHFFLSEREELINNKLRSKLQETKRGFTDLENSLKKRSWPSFKKDINEKVAELAKEQDSRTKAISRLNSSVEALPSSMSTALDAILGKYSSELETIYDSEIGRKITDLDTMLQKWRAIRSDQNKIKADHQGLINKFNAQHDAFKEKITEMIGEGGQMGLLGEIKNKLQEARDQLTIIKDSAAKRSELCDNCDKLLSTCNELLKDANQLAKYLKLKIMDALVGEGKDTLPRDGVRKVEVNEQ